VTETIATNVQTVTDTAKTTNDESSGEGKTGASSQKTQQDKTTTPDGSSTLSSQETNQKTSPKSTKEATATKVPVEKSTSTTERQVYTTESSRKSAYSAEIYNLEVRNAVATSLLQELFQH
jgi:hypothetical protein